MPTTKANSLEYVKYYPNKNPSTKSKKMYFKIEVDALLKTQRQQFREILLSKLFYNPGITRYLKLTEQEVDDLLTELEEK